MTLDLGDLNIVAIPAQPKPQPVKKKKNNKFERRRRRAEQARKARDETSGGKKVSNARNKEQPQVVISEHVVEATEEMSQTDTWDETAADADHERMHIVEEKLGSDTEENQTHANKITTTKPVKVPKEEKKIDSEEFVNQKNSETKEENPIPVKASRRRRGQMPEDQLEQEEEHAKYMAEFHARPLELDRRSGARSVIRVSKDSSHLFVAEDWGSLAVNPRIVQTLTSRFELAKPTAIQSKTIQTFQANPKNNVLIHSETGSGKTLAFLLPILQSLAYGNVSGEGEMKKESRKELGTKCIILSPTRELASQTLQVVERLCQANFAGWIVAGGLLGGDSRQSEKSRLRKGLAVLVATPGRLLDHLQKTESLLLNLKGKLEWLVLDEADRLLDMGLGDQVRQIVQVIRANEASKSQSWLKSVLVSATVTQSVQDLAKERMLCGDQEWVWVKGGKMPKLSSEEEEKTESVSAETKEEVTNGYSESTPRQLEQFHLTVTAKLRLSSLVAFLALRISKGERVVVFMGTCASVDYHYHLFEACSSIWDRGEKDETKGLFGHKATVFKLHGSVAHEKRSQTLKNFDAVSSSAILLTTDVSARGLNLQGVDWTVQYDPPCEISDYVHRVGRVARAGKAGHSLLFLLPSETAYLDVLKTKGIQTLTALSLSSTLNQAASICNDATEAGLANGGGGTAGKDKSNRSKGSSRLGEYFALEVQRRFEDCVVKDDMEAKKAKKENKRKRKGEAPKKKEGILTELARDAFVSFLRAYSTKKEAAVRSIFSARALHVGHVARSFALKEPPKSLVSKHRQNKKEQEQEEIDAQANKPKSLSFSNSTPKTASNAEPDGYIMKSYFSQDEPQVFKRPKFANESESTKGKNAKALLLENAFKMQSNLMDAM